jgi:CRP/FNR family cyclic AMP-dependent transcriptional regulator
MSFTLSAGNAFGLLAMALCFASFVVKSMVTLRLLALAANVCFMLYGYMESVALSLVFNGILLPVNAQRLWEIRRTSAEIVRATRDSPVSQWLLPHMTRRAFRAGDVLFRKGDRADEIFYIASGRVRIEEAGRILGPEELIGEIGLFSPENKRTQSVVCDTDGELYRMTGEMIYRLYYQNPKLGFYFMRLIAQRLLRDAAVAREASARR